MIYLKFIIIVGSIVFFGYWGARILTAIGLGG